MNFMIFFIELENYVSYDEQKIRVKGEGKKYFDELVDVLKDYICKLDKKDRGKFIANLIYAALPKKKGNSVTIGILLAVFNVYVCERSLYCDIRRGIKEADDMLCNRQDPFNMVVAGILNLSVAPIYKWFSGVDIDLLYGSQKAGELLYLARILDDAIEKRQFESPASNASRASLRQEKVSDVIKRSKNQ